MATLVNKMNRGVKVIIPNMREFRAFYSDNEGVIGMFFKRDWEEESTNQEDHWKPSEEQMEVLLSTQDMVRSSGYQQNAKVLASIYEQLKKLM